MSNNSKLILVTGVPCSGKTSLIKELRKTFDFTFIEVDDIKDGIFGKKPRIGNTYKALKLKVKAITENIINTNLSIGNNVVVENTFWDEVQNPNWYKRFKYKNIYIIRCIASKEQIFKRLKLRNLKRDINKIKNIESFNNWLIDEPIDVDMSIGIKVKTENMNKTLQRIKEYTKMKELNNKQYFKCYRCGTSILSEDMIFGCPNCGE